MTSKTLHIQAFQIAESINIKKLRSEFTAEVFMGNNSELFYYFPDNERFVYIFNYGVIMMK
jgi:required for meiotic nuclear division protein 1